MKRLLLASVVSVLAVLSAGCHCCWKGRKCDACGGGAPTFSDPYLSPAPEYSPSAPAEKPTTFAPGRY